LKIALGAGSKRFSLGQKRPRRSLRKIWQANGVPPWERSLTPVVFFGNEALFAGNIGLSGCYFAEENQPGITIKWHQGTSTG
jgi:tRNA(Ile)-lysidine synthase